MKKRFILLKDSPELKAGAVLEEKYENSGNYICITPSESHKFSDQKECFYSRQVVMENPEWFEEVSMVYLTKKQLSKFKKLIK